MELDEEDKALFRTTICSSFNLTPDQLRQHLSGGGGNVNGTGNSIILPTSEDAFRQCFPQGGFCQRYDELTQFVEAPVTFHIMCVLTILGAALRRRVWMERGFYSLYPNLSIVLIAPAGAAKKGAAVSIAEGLLPPEVVNVLAEKLTPEAIVEALAEEESVNGKACGLLWAPELSILLGKQKYNDGMIPLLNELLECKPHWKSRTISRGETELNNIYLSLLGASTPDLFGSSMSSAALDGGFMSRIFLVVEESSSRSFSSPRLDKLELQRLQGEVLKVLQRLEGEIHLSPEADKLYDEWYNTPDIGGEFHLKLAAYLERKPDHCLRIAILYHFLEHTTLTVCESCMHYAIKTIEFFEKRLPIAFNKLFESRDGEDVSLILKVLQRNNGMLDHDKLMAKTKHRLSFQSLRNHLNTLKESGEIKEVHTSVEHYYILKRKE